MTIDLFIALGMIGAGIFAIVVTIALTAKAIDRANRKLRKLDG